MLEKAARSGERSSIDEEQMNELVHALADGIAAACGHEVERNNLNERLEDVLSSLGVDVVCAEELERKAKHEEFAEFVDALVKNPLDYALTRAKEVFSGCDSEDTTTHKLADSVKQLRRLKLHLEGDDRRAVRAMAVELAKRHAAALGHAVPTTADDDALLGSLADAQAAADPDRTGPMVSGKEIA